MPNIITIAEAFERWNEQVKPEVISQFSASDIVALSESWNDYTDGLCKSGELNALQYHHCPAWDDDIPDEDGAFLLECMGVEMKPARIQARSDGSDWSADASHWSCFIRRVGVGAAKPKEGFAVEYSMGSAHRDSPELVDVFGCLLSDADGTEDTFEVWADEHGYDSDSRKAERLYNVCKETAAKLVGLFTKAELADLREVFADR